MSKITACPECHGACVVPLAPYCIVNLHNPHAIVKNEICQVCEGFGFIDCEDKETCKRICQVKERSKCENY